VSSGATTQVSPPSGTTLAFTLKLSVFGKETCTDITELQNSSQQEREAKLRQHISHVQAKQNPCKNKSRESWSSFPSLFKKAPGVRPDTSSGSIGCPWGGNSDIGKCQNGKQ